MALAPETKSIKYSPTSTPILDGLRPLPRRNRLRLTAGEYFFVSGSVILSLIGLPLLRRTAESLASLGFLSSILISCLLIPAAALLLGQGVHEAGHLCAGWLAGFRLVRANAQPFDERNQACGALSICCLSLKPATGERLTHRLAILFAGGPAANFLAPAVLELVAGLSAWGSAATLFVHAFSGVSVLEAIADLLPDSDRGNFSDGSRLLMLLKRDAAAERWLAILDLQAALDGGEQAAAWDQARMLKLAAVADDSHDAVAAAWLGYTWSIERQDITSATKYLEEALAAVPAARGALRDRLFFESAMFQAWFREDSGSARHWAGHIHHRLAPLAQPRLSIAMLWADGKLFDAWEKLSEYLREIQSRPSSPDRDLAEKHAREWKSQMESRMLTRAWRTIFSMSRQVDQSAPKGLETASW
jgi:hypothetical protein